MARLFFSYSHKDEELRNELEKHMSMLLRDGTIAAWHDRRITAGSDVDASISTELEAADLILLLVSASFLASNYCYEKEMARALERHAEGTAVVIPVILSPCDWLSSPLRSLMATPPDGKAITKFANMDEAFVLVTQAVRQAAVKANRAAPSAAAGSTLREEVVPVRQAQALQASVDPAVRSSNLRVRRTFTDHDKQVFRENCYEFMARFFENSLDELQARNPQIQGHFKRIDATRFTASIFENGKRVAECLIADSGTGMFGGNGITYSNNTQGFGNSFNEFLTVGDDGYTQHLSGGMFHGDKSPMTPQGAAEFYWSLLIGGLQ